jgi:hypothetical protein
MPILVYKQALNKNMEKPPNIATVLRQMNPGDSHEWPADIRLTVRGIVAYLQKRNEGFFTTEKQGDILIVTKKKND